MSVFINVGFHYPVYRHVNLQETGDCIVSLGAADDNENGYSGVDLYFGTMEQAQVELAKASHAVNALSGLRSPQEQVDRLAKFIMDEIPGESRQSEGAVDTAIRLLRPVAAAKEGRNMLNSSVGGAR